MPVVYSFELVKNSSSGFLRPEIILWLYLVGPFILKTIGFLATLLIEIQYLVAKEKMAAISGVAIFINGWLFSFNVFLI